MISGLMILPSIYSGSLVCLLSYLLCCQNKSNEKEIDEIEYERIINDEIDNEDDYVIEFKSYKVAKL
jgi:hypothetical protein